MQADLARVLHFFSNIHPKSSAGEGSEHAAATLAAGRSPDVGCMFSRRSASTTAQLSSENSMPVGGETPQ